jgi:hypothetical protein
MTERSIRTAVLGFGNWCALRQLCPLPALPETVADWLRDGAAGGWRTDKAGRPQPVAVATLKQRAVMIARLHKAAGPANPCDSEAVRCGARPLRLTLRAGARHRGSHP